VPFGAGVASAIGLVGSDPTVELVQTRLVALADADPADVEALFAHLETRGRAELGVDAAALIVVRRAADLRCRGQAHELTVTGDPGPLTAVGLERLTDRFRDEYARAYGIRSAAPVELVSVRVRLVRPVTRPAAEPALLPAHPVAARPASRRAVRFSGAAGYVDAPVYDWASLTVGAVLGGPALVAGPDTTVVVPSDARVDVDERRNLRLRPPGASDDPGRAAAPRTPTG
jgi:N-methylhydantoinase A/oxoprolinase/acetone carboxylase beta subunit